MAIKAAPDLNSAIDEMSAQEIRSLIKYAESKLLAKQEDAKQALINEVKERAEELGLSIEDLIQEKSSAKKQTGKRGAAPIKYVGPNDETWTGRGRVPRWLAALEATNHSREEFAVNKSETQAK